MAYILKPDEETAKLFSDKTRLRILDLLSEKEMTNSQIAGMLNLSKPTISHHLKLLLDGSIVKISRVEHEEHGIQMKFYSVNPNILSVEALKDNLLTEQISKEIQEALGSISGLSGNQTNSAFLRMLKSTILNMGIDMDRPFYDAGYKIGANVISKHVKSNTLKEILTELAVFWKKLKLGNVELVSENKIRVTDCYQCGDMPNMGKPLCPSDAGIIAGVLDTVCGKRHSVIETKCWGTGYDFCEFEIEES
jgi:predicted hydrocarbon binding protein/DNA-binding HxlR family transcriptional regulator